MDLITGIICFVALAVAILLAIGLAYFGKNPTPFINNSWYMAFFALVIHYAIVFTITLGFQSLVPNLPFFDDVENQTKKNAYKSLLMSAIIVGGGLVLWVLIMLFILPNLPDMVNFLNLRDGVKNAWPLDTAWGWMRIILGTLPAEWILSRFEGFTPTFTAATASNTAISAYAGIGGKKGKKKGKKGGGFLGGDDAGSIPAAQWSQIFWTTTK